MTAYTLGSAQAPCTAGTCTINLGLLSPQSHTFKVSSFGVAPATNTTTLISQGSLTQTLTAGTNNALSLTLVPVNAIYSLTSAVKQYNAVSKTFGNTVKFPTRGGRSLPAYYDVLAVDSVGDRIPAVLCGNDASVVITNISNAAHPNRFRVEVQAVGAHTLSVQAGTGCTSGAAALTTQAVTGVSTGVQTIAGGLYHSLALLSDGTVRAWGYNGYGQLGNGTKTDSTTPVTVSTLSDVVSLSAGDIHSLALLSDGTVQAWGNNVYGQLGNGTTTNSSVPVTVSISGVMQPTP